VGGGSQGQARALQQGEAQAAQPIMARHFLTTQSPTFLESNFGLLQFVRVPQEHRPLQPRNRGR
jgi:hypothetical protein